jgi:hypothetical protein
VDGKALSEMLALKPERGKPAFRNFREGDGNGGIIRSPLRAIALPDNMLWEQSSIRYTRRTFWDSRMGFGLGATRMTR